VAGRLRVGRLRHRRDAVAGLAVVASLRSQDRREAHEGGAIAFDVVTGACVLAIAAAIVLGIYIMTDK
jgi:hypothetical protein